jgi:predicted unusual protein kinase regulating ubiquinone biosynthesis (AarF/ABC1/UbiB family)
VSRPDRPLPLGERVDRARRIGTTFGRVYLSLRSLRWVERRLDPPDMAERWTRQHRRNARNIRRTAIAMQGLVLKGCQFLSARADVLPAPYVEVLGTLQDRVPPRDAEIIRAVVEEELGRPIDEVFEAFAPEPVAAASLAQVHEARLLGGRRVAVKVQYPGIGTLVRSDLSNLRTLFHALEVLEPDFDLVPLLEELGEMIPRELDFRAEAENATRIARDLEARGDVRVPEILPEWSTARILVMEFFDGIKVTDREALEAAGIDPAWVARTLIEVFCEQILVHGFFHADPHPGNLFVLPAPVRPNEPNGSTGPTGSDGSNGAKLGLVDFGLAKELPKRFREGVLEFAAALLQGESEGMGRALIDLGFETRDGEEDALHEIAEVLLHAGKEIRSAGRVDPELFARLRDEIPERVRRNPVVHIPHHLVLVGRSLALLLGVNAALGERVDFLRAVAPYVLGPRR